MVLSPRLIQLFTILLKEDKVVSVQKLAEIVQVSKRTVQRELDNTEGFLRKYGLRLGTKAGTGIWLEGESHSKALLLEELQSRDSNDYINKEKRRTSLILEILRDREPKKLYYYSNIFGVSEATISSDMEVIEGWFDRFELILVRKQGYGVALEGTEKNYRLAIKRFLDENPDTEEIKLAIGERKWTILGDFYEKENKGIFQLIDYKILKQVVLCLCSIRDNKLMRLTNSSFSSLVLHVTIAIMRILKKDFIEGDSKTADRIIYHEDYNLALRIAQDLEKEFQMKIPETEIAYILLHISGSKIQSADLYRDKDRDIEVNDELLGMINEMIDEYDRELSYELKQDDELIMGLLAHLKPTFIRLKNRLSITNPLLSQIQEAYPDIYKKCKRVGEVVKNKYGFILPEDEIGYLAMHFGAAGVRLEDKKESIRKVDLGIICVSGIGISKLMHSKLKNFLKDRVQIYTYGKEDLSPGVIKNLDFMISNVDLEEVTADVLMVSPLLTDNELKQIDEKVRKYANTPKKSSGNSEFAKQLEHVNFFINQIKGIIKDFQLMKVSETISFAELLVAVSEKLSPFNRNRLMIQEDILRREKIASQIIPEYGFALLHSRTAGVVKPIFSVCVTKDRGPFTDLYFKGIRAVVIMLAPEEDELRVNSDIMGHISSQLIEDAIFLRLIFNGEQEMIRTYLERILRQHFKQYLETV